MISQDACHENEKEARGKKSCPSMKWERPGAIPVKAGTILSELQIYYELAVCQLCQKDNAKN